MPSRYPMQPYAIDGKMGTYLIHTTSVRKANSFALRRWGLRSGPFECWAASTHLVQQHLLAGGFIYHKGGRVMPRHEAFVLAGLPPPPVVDYSRVHPLQEAARFRDAKDALGFSFECLADAFHVDVRAVRRWCDGGPPWTVAVVMGQWLDPEAFQVPPCPPPIKRRAA